MPKNDCILFSVKVLTPDGKLKREINIPAVKKHHWNEFEKEGHELASITTNKGRLKIKASIKKEIDLINFDARYDAQF